MEKGIHFATVLSALTELGYHVEWRLINTRHFGLAQNRERVLILGSLGVKDNYPTIRLASLKDLCEGLESNFSLGSRICQVGLRLKSAIGNLPIGV